MKLRLGAVAAILTLVLGCEAAGGLRIGGPSAMEYQERGAAVRSKATEIRSTINDAQMWRLCAAMSADFERRQEALQSALNIALVRSDELRELGEAYDILGQQLELLEQAETDLEACVQRLEDASSWTSDDFPEDFDYLFAQRNRARVERQLAIVREAVDTQQDVTRDLAHEKASGFDVPQECSDGFERLRVGQQELLQEAPREPWMGEVTVGLLRRYESALAFLAFYEEMQRDLENCNRSVERTREEAESRSAREAREAQEALEARKQEARVAQERWIGRVLAECRAGTTPATHHLSDGTSYSVEYPESITCVVDSEGRVWRKGRELSSGEDVWFWDMNPGDPDTVGTVDVSFPSERTDELEAMDPEIEESIRLEMERLGIPYR